MPTLKIRRDGRETTVSVEENALLSSVLEAQGYWIPHPCGGRGTCAKCAVRITGDVPAPTPAEEQARCRLSCQIRIVGDCTVELPSEREMTVETGGDDLPNTLDPLGEGVGAALDIGTTTLALRAFDLQSGRAVGEAAMLNPQCSVAADVMGRIGAALEGALPTLNSQILSAMDALLDSAGPGKSARTLVVTGNTTMLYLFTGRNPQSLSCAPFDADCLFDQWQTRNGARIYLPPCMNAFVGADITCGALASGMCDQPDTALLCDIGTNGEIALWKDGVLYVTSTAAGPAFEGAGISCGCGSVTGAIDRVWVEQGRLGVHTIANAPAVGLCGSGLIDAVAALLELGEVDETGAMEEESALLAGEVRLLPRDVRAVQLAKAAIAAGIETILEYAHTPLDQVRRLYIAGGFGRHLNLASAAAIGLLPRALISRARVIGNASLSGAARILLDRSNVEKCRRIAEASVHVNLGGNPVFNEHYMEQMLFEVE